MWLPRWLHNQSKETRLVDEQAKVRQFMTDVKHLDVPTKPYHPVEAVRSLCSALMSEELLELDEAMHGEDMNQIAKELADLLYVVYYTANCYGLIMEPIFSAVHNSNMTKDGGFREDGKLLKGPGYRPPEIHIQ